MPCETGTRIEISRAGVLKFFAALIAVTFLLRIFYAGHLYEDDGLWFTAAEELLRGKALYREIYFDKPPAIALLYAGLFKLFGAHIIVIRLFTILYSVAISFVLYLFGSHLYDRRAGLLAAAMFALFSTTYTPGHMQALNTDFLMALPYTLGTYLLVRSRTERAWLALAGGACMGVAFQTNPKAAFGLIFFALFLIPTRILSRSRTPAIGSLLLAITGFIIGCLPFLIYLAANQSLSAYWASVWEWGARYAGYNSPTRGFVTGISISASYFSLNNTLLVALAFLVVITTGRMRKASFNDGKDLQSDVTLLLWFIVSYAGIAVGGRFYSHYFFQVLPDLCLIGARGFVGIALWLRTRSAAVRRIGFVALAAGLLFTVIRFHGRTAVLAADWLRGEKSEMTRQWRHEMLKHEERLVAAFVRNLPEGAEAADRLSSEAIRALPRQDGPESYLFVWGYRPEIYYWSGLIPASRYLSSQPLTGVPADVHYFGEQYRLVLDEAQAAAARDELLRDLERARPKYIVDELGFFNADLSIQSYPELREFMKNYGNPKVTGRFFIYRSKEFSRRKRSEPGSGDKRIKGS